MFAVFSYLALVLYYVFFVSSIIADKKWTFGKNFISDLGVSKSRTARYLFNGGCVICGGLFSISMLEYILETDLTIIECVVPALAIAMGISLAMVGAVNEDKMPHHKWVAFSFFAIRFVLVAALLLADLYGTQYILAIATLILMAFALVSAKKFDFPTTEVIWSVSLMGIIIVHFFLIF
jgi:hypothetical membrane protein